jgi:vancomycin permeability regulator SanA
LIALVVVFAISSPFLARGITSLNANGRIYFEDSMPSHKVAVVFGAGVRNGQPSAVLYDRVASAVELYRAGKVSKLLMSGDNRFANYNEPGVMRNTAMQMGVPDEDIVLDYAGRSTYETCYRASAIFGLSDAVLVTQDYHLDRAVFTCGVLGVDAVGYAADQRGYRGMTWFQVREIGATLNAFWELFITRPAPVLGEPVSIE